MLLLFFFVALTICEVYERYGVVPLSSDNLVTYGHNNYLQAGISDVGNKETPSKFSANMLNTAFFNKDWKFACGTENNVFVVMDDDEQTIGGLGYQRILDEDENQSDFIEIDKSAMGTETIAELYCSFETVFARTEEGGLYGFGKNEMNAIDSTQSSTTYITKFVDIRSGDLADKKIKLFAGSKRSSFFGYTAIDEDGAVYYIGSNIGGNCEYVSSDIDVWTKCNAGAFNTSSPDFNLKIIDVVGGYESIFFINETGKVYFTGRTNMAGMGDDGGSSITTEPILLVFEDYYQDGTQSSLAEKDVISIACTVNPYCMALDSTMKGIHTWGNTNSHDLLTRESLGEIAQKVSLTGITSEDIIQIRGTYVNFYFVDNALDIFGWGGNYYHQLSDSSTNTYNTPIETGSIFLSVSGSYKWVCQAFGQTMYYLKGGAGLITFNIILVVLLSFLLL